MNKNLLVILACLFLTSSLFAQNPPAQNPQSGAVQRPPRAYANTGGGVLIAPIPDQVYMGAPYMPEPVIRDGNKTLIKNKDYTVSYTNNVNVGVAIVPISGRGNYRDSKDIRFNIIPKSVGLVTVNPVNDQTFRNTQITPDLQLVDNGRPLVKGIDYTLSYSNNLNVGIASVTITGKGNYRDTRTLNFKIVAKSISFSTATTAPAPTNNSDNKNKPNQQQRPRRTNKPKK